MIDSERQADEHGGRPSRKPLAVGLAAALGLGVVIVGVWLLRGDRNAPVMDQDSDVAGNARAIPGEAPFEPAFPSPREDVPPSAPAAPVPDVPDAPVEAIPMQADRDAAAEGWRVVEGLVVRASDESPVDSATIIAPTPDAGTTDSGEPLQTQTDRGGRFHLNVPRDVNFVVFLPASGHSPGDSQLGTRAVARIEWANDDPQGSRVRVVVHTGWQLDVLMVDGEGQPRAGVVVKGGGRNAKSDAEGRCVLHDLDVSGKPITLTLQAPGSKAVSCSVDAPDPGSLRKDVTLKAP